MKAWIVFVILTVICWGAYVPVLHNGQSALGKNSALRAFLFVGLAYFVMSLAIVAYLYFGKSEPWEFTSKGAWVSTVAGILGAIGALGIVFAMKNHGRPLVVAPLVFAGAPIINTIVSMMWHKPTHAPGLLFYGGLAMAAGGAALVLVYKPT